LDVQPLVVLTNVKVTDPGDTAVITPPLVILAIAGLLLDHVPPELGDAEVNSPIHSGAVDASETFGLPFTISV